MDELREADGVPRVPSLPTAGRESGARMLTSMTDSNGAGSRPCDNAAMDVTMKDIAEELGISIGTVSKVLRDHPDISPETRERVRLRMKELNYRPNLTARALVTGRTHSIGFIVPDLVHPFFGEVGRGLSRVLRKKGYNLIISSSEEDQELERRGIEQLLARRVDALILASSEKDADTLRHLEKQRTPYILIDRRPAGLKSNFIGVDDEEIGILATQHLIEMGCRRIAHISGPAISTALGRLKGYRRALDRHGLSVGPEYVITRDHGDEESDRSGYEAMKTLLALERPPDAVFCYNDPTAMGAMEAASERGVRIPQDLAVVGAGNVRYARFLRITSIDQQSEDIGDRAGKLALRLIGSKTAQKPQTILLKPLLVLRESSSRRTGGPVGVE